MKPFALLALIPLLASCQPFDASDTAAALPNPQTHDGRAGTVCPYWAKHPEVQLCSPSLLRLVTRGEDYENTYVKVSGYLQEKDGAMYLCAAKGLCDDGDFSAAVQLPKLPRLEAKIDVSHRVTIIGKFRSSTRGRAGQVAGIFIEVDEAYRSSGP